MGDCMDNVEIACDPIWETTMHAWQPYMTMPYTYMDLGRRMLESITLF